ncbi:hypothetical protein BS78_05G284900 [Paspalum vaginatum]|nr:hypothetical protein BS78_05G284900 [Paspalum vaginatum]
MHHRHLLQIYFSCRCIKHAALHIVQENKLGVQMALLRETKEHQRRQHHTLKVHFAKKEMNKSASWMYIPTWTCDKLAETGWTHACSCT